MIKPLAVLLACAVAPVCIARTFLVTRAGDDGSAGTLRWAIEQNNASPDGHRIEIRGDGTSPFVIRLDRLLPPVKGPAIVTAVGHVDEVAVDGVATPLPKSVPAILDGSNIVDMTTTRSCPAEDGKGDGPNVRSLQKPALAVVDSGGVEISGLEIRNFCIGVMLLRSHDNRIHHNIIHDMIGAAGILVTGDAGDAVGSQTEGRSVDNTIESNVIYDTGDGAECTRGSSRMLFRNNLFFQSSPDTVSPRSQGVECANAGNDDIRFVGNVFRGYSDGLQLNRATNVLVEDNTIVGNTYGITSSGSAIIRNNTIAGNRMGIGPTKDARVTISRNRIHDNGEPILSLPTSAGGTTDPASKALLGIDVGTDGASRNDLAGDCADRLPDCDGIQNHPVLDARSQWDATGHIVLRGILQSRPGAPYTIELFANRHLDAAGGAEGERFVGLVQVTTDSMGISRFEVPLPFVDPLGDRAGRAIFTATATSGQGKTSEFSPGLELVRKSAR